MLSKCCEVRCQRRNRQRKKLLRVAGFGDSVEQVHCCDRGTFVMTLSIWRPQPAQVVLPHAGHEWGWSSRSVRCTLWHIPRGYASTLGGIRPDLKEVEEKTGAIGATRPVVVI